MVQDVSDQDFKNEVLDSNLPVLVDFWAEWCGPCRQLAPVVSDISAEMQGKVKVVKVNIDSSPDTPGKFGVRGIPTLMLFKDGKNIATKVGALPKSALMDWLTSELK